MIEIDLAEYDKDNEDGKIRILAGSHHKIIIDKLYGPTSVDDLMIEWTDDGCWNILDKQKVIEAIEKKIKEYTHCGSEEDSMDWADKQVVDELNNLKKELGLEE